MNILYPLLRNISRLLQLFIPDEIWAKSTSSLKNYINRNESPGIKLSQKDHNNNEAKEGLIPFYLYQIYLSHIKSNSSP